MTLPKAKTRTVDGARHYVVILDGVEFNVRSASGLVSILDKPAIAGWMVNQHLNKAHEMFRKARGIEADDFRAIIRSAVRRDGSPAAESGTRVHSVMEAYFTDAPIPDHEETPWALKWAEEIEAEMAVQPIQVRKDRSGVELTVCRVENGYPIWAGTTDMIGQWEIDGEVHRGCIDWKSGASGLWPDSILTTSVYSGATHWVDDETHELHEFDSPLDAGALVWVRPEGWAFSPISPAETEDAIEVLRSLVIAWQWKQNARVADPVNAVPLERESRARS